MNEAVCAGVLPLLHICSVSYARWRKRALGTETGVQVWAPRASGPPQGGSRAFLQQSCAALVCGNLGTQPCAFGLCRAGASPDAGRQRWTCRKPAM